MSKQTYVLRWNMQGKEGFNVQNFTREYIFTLNFPNDTTQGKQILAEIINETHFIHIKKWEYTLTIL